MVRHYKRKPTARGYKSYTTEDLRKAVRKIKEGKLTIRKAHIKYGISTGTLSYHVRGMHTRKVGHPLTFSKKEELAFVDHIVAVSEWGFPFDCSDIQYMVNAYLQRTGRIIKKFKNNTPSRDWVRSFIKRHKDNLTTRMCQNIKVGRASVTPDVVQQYFDNLKEALLDDDGNEIPPAKLFNYDETNLSDDPGSKRCIFKRGVKYPERKRDFSKSSTSLMFCGSASGKILPPYVVYKAEHMWNSWMEGGHPKTRYNRTKSGWFDSCTFTDWFQSMFIPNVVNLPGRKVLIGDNLSSHFTPEVVQSASENEITFICLPKNSTHLCQPLDIAFFAPMKRAWRSTLDKWKQKQKKSQTLGKDVFPRLLKTLMAKLNFGAADEDGCTQSDNIISGFRKSGIFPFNPEEVLSRLPASVRKEVPGADVPVPVISTVSDVVLDMLKAMRYGQDDDEPPAKKRRSKVSVIPGKSISLADIGACSSTGTTPSTSTGNASRTSRQKKNLETPESDLESASESDTSGTIIDPFTDEDMPDEAKSITEGSYVVVKFILKNINTNKCSYKYYVAKIIDISEKPGKNSEYTLMCMRRSVKSSKFVWPQVADETTVPKEDIICVLPKPLCEKRGVAFDEAILKKYILQ